jgi:ADP-heptose:LPS heptosyltransferase
VLRALKLGDLLTAVPALRALARAFPLHRRTLAAPSALGPLALHTGAVDEVVDTRPLGSLDPSLRGAEVAVNLHGRGPQSTARLAATGPSRLIAFDMPLGPRWRDDEHEVIRWCRLLEESGIPADPTDLRVAPPPRSVAGVARGATIVHPGAADRARCWPQERWAAVARSLRDAGRPVVVTGSAAELGLARAVASDAGLSPHAVLAGRTDHLELLATVAAAACVISADTGVAHVATATGTPSVVLFGPMPPSTWGPPDLPRHIALWAGLEGDPHATTVDPGLLRLSVDDVLAAVDRLGGPDVCGAATTVGEHGARPPQWFPTEG